MAVAKSLELIARSDSVISRIRDRFPTYLSDLREDPSWLLMFLLGRTAVGRGLHRRATHGAAAVSPPEDGSMFDFTTAQVIQGLNTEGLFSGLRLPDALLAEMQAFARETPCFGNHDRRLELLPAEHLANPDPDNPVTSGHYFERSETCPAVVAVQQDPLLNSVARTYLDERACVISTRLWWSFPAATAEAAEPAAHEMLHFDLDDWRMLKFFFYLTPVSAESGPHLYVRGSHRNHVLKHQLSLTVGRPLQEVLDAYGEDKMVSVHGEAGIGFAEDPFGFHAGSLAQQAPRLMLEVGFGVNPPSRRRFYGERILS
jgi:hypothetical protein